MDQQTDDLTRYTDKVAPAGSDFYYATRFIDAKKRNQLIALFALIQEILEIPDECHDEAVATTKLQWWQEEIARIYAGEARHPAAKLWIKLLDEHNLAQEYIEEILAGVAMDLDSSHFETHSELSLYLHKTGSMPYLLAAIICGFDDHRATKYAHHLGENLRYLELIQNTQLLLTRGRFYLPMEDLKLGVLTLQDFTHPVTPDRIQKQFAYQCARIRNGLETAKQHLPASDCKSLRPLISMHLIAEHTLRHLEKQNFRLLNGSLELTPLKKVWVAWRNK